MKNILPLILLLLLSACTWVKLSQEGAGVSIITSSALAQLGDDCTKTGGTSVSVVDKVVLNRSSEKVEQELQTLARNRAADRGNILVANSEIIDGEQGFDIYQCSE